ncbi:MAG: DUF3408 domain-containing protein [Bacteroidia bacterium]|nr:DUF3408 domain-containing protein [Bacteroidia bacterium]
MATKKSNSNFDLAAYLEGNPPSDKRNLSQQKKEEIISQTAEPSQPSQPAEKPTEPLSISAKRISQKQRKASLEEYKNSFLNPPKITDRKTVYLSAETRDRLDEIVRRLGERGSSVSGFIENMAREHLDTYHDEIEQWKRL